MLRCTYYKCSYFSDVESILDSPEDSSELSMHLSLSPEQQQLPLPSYQEQNGYTNGIIPSFQSYLANEDSISLAPYLPVQNDGSQSNVSRAHVNNFESNMDSEHLTESTNNSNILNNDPNNNIICAPEQDLDSIMCETYDNPINAKNKQNIHHPTQTSLEEQLNNLPTDLGPLQVQTEPSDVSVCDYYLIIWFV